VIARTLGIDVLDGTLEKNVSGALFKRPGEDPQIILNTIDSPNRKRFTCAHEIGHFVRRSDNPDEYAYVDFRGPLSSAGMEEEEIYANTFAASLLMPEEDVRRFEREGLNDIEMAIRFDVSREAMQYRLKNLGIAV
jgi:Zn-dependent peptidase ImmA (M78 family)